MDNKNPALSLVADSGWDDAAVMSVGDESVDKIAPIAAKLAGAATGGCGKIDSYLDAQVKDETHREVIGPLMPGGGASGVVIRKGETVASWGEFDRPEMLFSATKTFVSLVAGVAYDAGLLQPDRRVVDDVSLSHLLTGRWSNTTWTHLLQQTSGWDGELWGKPACVDAQSGEPPPQAQPGASWAYNDVRVNLLCLALTLLWRRPLDDVLTERITGPTGASDNWSWHGYANSSVEINGRAVPVVVGGAHWGGGLFMSARDMAIVGTALLTGDPPVSRDWLSQSWTPSARNPSYGYLWWLNDEAAVFPTAPRTGRCARGNLGRHLLWVDPRRDLVIAAHWTEGIADAIRDISAAMDDAVTTKTPIGQDVDLVRAHVASAVRTQALLARGTAGPASRPRPRSELELAVFESRLDGG